MKLSVIIPVYNVAPYLEDCLRSVMRQTYTGSMECLIIDDCSTDDSYEIAERTIATYHGPISFHILQHEHNRGLSASRNTGTLAAKGEYLYYIDSDDEITDDCIRLLMEQAEKHPDAEMVQGNSCCHTMTNDSVVRVKEFSFPIANTNDDARTCYYLNREMSVAVWNKLLRRDFIIENHLLNKEGIIFEDQLWTFYLLKHLNKACYVSTVTYHQKKRPHSITTGTDKVTMAYNYAIVYQNIMENLTPGYEQDEFNYHAAIIGGIYLRYAHQSPEIKQVFQSYCAMSKKYCTSWIRFRLAVCHFLGQFKHGWVIYALLVRVKRPYLIPRDIKRVFKFIAKRLSRRQK